MKPSTYNLKVHWTHKLRIKRLYTIDCFTDEELAIMYHTDWSVIKNITRGLKQLDRV